MTEVTITVDREDVERIGDWLAHRVGPREEAARLLAALPPKPRTFSDEECLALARALWGFDLDALRAHHYLTRLAAAGWRAPAALSAPIDVDEVQRRMKAKGWYTEANFVGAVLDILRDMNKEAGHG